MIEFLRSQALRFGTYAKKEGFLFSLILLFEFLIALLMILARRIPIGHDGLQYFELQYYFLNHSVIYGEIPQWIPFFTHGTVASWWYAIQASILQNALGLIAPLLKFTDFITVFHLNVLFDEILLLTGTWLLAKRFFASRLTIYFVAVSIMGSTVCFTQPWYNFHFYYALPLAIYFFHQFLDSGKWR